MKFVLILSLACILCCHSYAQQQKYTVVNGKLTPISENGDPLKKYYLKDIKNLDSLSNIYFEMGDDQFLIIDAYKDGLIKTNEGKGFEFRDRVLTLNNKSIPEPYYSNYLKKINSILNKEHLLCSGCSTRISLGLGDGQPGEDVSVFEPRNEFEIRSKQKLNDQSYLESYLERRRNDSLLVRTLFVNHIINKSTNIHIRYSTTKFYINDVKFENQNLLHDCILFAEKINGSVPVDENDYFGLYYTKSELARYCQN